MRRAIVIFFALVAVAWVVLSPRVWPGLYASRLFHPDLKRGKQADLQAFRDVENYQVIFEAVDGSRLDGHLFINPHSTRVFLLHQGNAGDIAGNLNLIRLLLKSGASVFAYEPRGFGLSEGHPSVEAICEDGVSAYDALVKLGAKPRQIILYGVSLGGSVATYVSTKRQARGIVLQSTFSSLEKIAKENVGILKLYPSWMFPEPRLDNALIMSEPHAPLLILHGGRDSLISIAHSQEIFRRAAQPAEFVVCQRSTHDRVDSLDEPTFVGALQRFIRK